MKVLGTIVTLAGVVMFFAGGGLLGAGVAGLGILMLLVGFREPVKTCPLCAMRIPAAAAVCPHCQRDLREQPKP